MFLHGVTNRVFNNSRFLYLSSHLSPCCPLLNSPFPGLLLFPLLHGICPPESFHSPLLIGHMAGPCRPAAYAKLDLYICEAPSWRLTKGVTLTVNSLLLVETSQPKQQLQPTLIIVATIFFGNIRFQLIGLVSFKGSKLGVCFLISCFIWA